MINIHTGYTVPTRSCAWKITTNNSDALLAREYILVIFPRNVELSQINIWTVGLDINIAIMVMACVVQRTYPKITFTTFLPVHVIVLHCHLMYIMRIIKMNSTFYRLSYYVHVKLSVHILSNLKTSYCTYIFLHIITCEPVAILLL